MTSPVYVRFFEEIGIDDVPVVGGKTASIGEMYQKLSGEAARCRSERHSEVVVVSGLSRSPLFYDLGVGPRVSEGSNSCRRHSTKDQSPPLAGSPRRCPGLQEDEAAGAVPQTNWRCNE